jgi:hypothetical protein
MLYRLALTSGLMLASFASFAPTAIGQVVFNNVQSGIIEPEGGNLKVLKSTSPGTLNVNVPAGTSATIAILEPVLQTGSSSDPNGTTRVGYLDFNSSNLSSNGTNSAPLPIGDTNLKVGMRVERPTTFTPGSYNYRLTLSVTVTPN